MRVAPPLASTWLQRKVYSQASQSAGAALSRAAELQAPACRADRRDRCQCSGLALGRGCAPHTARTGSRGRLVLSESELDIQKQMMEQKKQRSWRWELVTETYTHCSSAIHFCWVTRPRAGSFMSWPLHKSGTQPPNYMRTAWGLKSLASKNDNKNTNICIYISACQEVAVEDAN